MDVDRVTRLERTWALDAVAIVEVLRTQDPSWRSERFPLAGGHAALCGPGLYVNRAIGAGIAEPLTEADLDLLERRSSVVGVAPAVDVSPVTHVRTVTLLTERGYAPSDRVAAFVRPIDDGLDVPDAFEIERCDGDLLELWQATTATGWGHTDPSARRASDAFARAAAVVDGEGFVVARCARDRRAVGCASVTIRDKLATLGGMSTVPDERRRGVQSALIAHRVRLAVDAGCDLICSSAVPGGPSERNLVRHGFRPSHTTTRYVLR